MENKKDPQLNMEDELKAENNLLKLKLGLEHGMKMDETDTSMLSPDIENQWLKSVYAFEQQFKDAKKVKVFDRIGRPAFKKWDTLTPAEVHAELSRLHVLMESHGLQLDVICKYDDAVIYKFITEELFEKEMDDMNVPGMTWHFIYEEFYPNHDHDLRRYASDFVKAIFKRPWNEEFDDIAFASNVVFSGAEYDRRRISSIIKVFQEAHESRRLKKFRIRDVTVGAQLTKAEVHADMLWSGKMKHGENVRHKGVCRFDFVRAYDYWAISEFYIPGFTK
jgi:hypothetical protein